MFFFCFLYFFYVENTVKCCFFTFFMINYMKTTLNCPSHTLCCNGVRINLAAHLWGRKGPDHLPGILGPNWATRKEDWTSTTGKNVGTWKSPLSRRGGGATFDLGAWTGKEERVQSAVVEEVSQTWSSSNIVWCFHFCGIMHSKCSVYNIVN